MRFRHTSVLSKLRVTALPVQLADSLHPDLWCQTKGTFGSEGTTWCLYQSGPSNLQGTGEAGYRRALRAMVFLWVSKALQARIGCHEGPALEQGAEASGAAGVTEAGLADD